MKIPQPVLILVGREFLHGKLPWISSLPNDLYLQDPLFVSLNTLRAKADDYRFSSICSILQSEGKLNLYRNNNVTDMTYSVEEFLHILYSTVRGRGSTLRQIGERCLRIAHSLMQYFVGHADERTEKLRFTKKAFMINWIGRNNFTRYISLNTCHHL